MDSAGAVKIEHEDVVYCYHNRNVTRIVYNCGRYTEAHIPLRKIEEKLSRKGFFRCHRNYLINLEHVGRLSEKDGEIILGKHLKVLVARRRRSKLLNILDQINSGIERAG